MKSKYVVYIVLLLIIAGLAYVVFGRKSTMMSQSAGSGTPASSSSSMSPTSLRDIFTKGIAETCTYTTTNSEGGTNGTVYFDSGKMRGNMTSNINGQATVAHVIMADKTMYSWTDGTTTGYKMAFDATASPSPVASSSTTTKAPSVDLNVQADYHCNPGVSDASVFTLPAGVTFTDLSAMIPTVPKSSVAPGASAGPNECAACASLTGDQKTQCMTVLKCQ